jgi:hypothetical protein
LMGGIEPAAQRLGVSAWSSGGCPPVRWPTCPPVVEYSKCALVGAQRGELASKLGPDGISREEVLLSVDSRATLVNTADRRHGVVSWRKEAGMNLIRRALVGSAVAAGGVLLTSGMAGATIHPIVESFDCANAEAFENHPLGDPADPIGQTPGATPGDGNNELRALAVANPAAAGEHKLNGECGGP